MDWDGEKLIHLQRKRCCKSEEVHSVMKEDLVGGKIPFGRFWGECRLVVDGDFDVEPESGNETVGAGREVVIKAPEGDSLFVDKFTW